MPRPEHRITKLFMMGLAAVMFGCFGVAIIRGELHDFHKGSAAKSWPSASGVVTQSRVAHVYSHNETLYRPFIEYRYQVGGHEYLADKIRVGNTDSDSGNGIAAQLAATYYPGKEVLVFYDPLNPQSAMLEPGVQWTSYFGFFGGPVVVLVGLFLGRCVLLELRRPGSVISI